MVSFLRRMIWPALAVVIASSTALAQEAAKQNLPTDQAVPSLMFFTLGAGLFVAIGAFVMFLRKRSNREATKRGLDLKR